MIKFKGFKFIFFIGIFVEILNNDVAQE